MKRLLAIAALSIGLAAPLSAQCAMCYRTAAAQNRAHAHVLNYGILALGAPPFLILAGFVAFVFMRGNKCAEGAPTTTASDRTESGAM